MKEVDAEDLVEAYLSIRGAREKLEAEYKAQDDKLKEDMSQIEAMMLTICNGIKADSLKTKSGTIMRSVKERYTCSDWDNFYKFVLEHQVPHLLEKRIHQTNFKLFNSEVETEGLPPGINVMREFAITVRKASQQ